MAVAMGGVIAADVVIITVGAEAEGIIMAGGTITTGKRHAISGDRSWCPALKYGARA
jgi:hypothetical protein